MKFLPLEELPILHLPYIVHTFTIDGVEHQIIGVTVQVDGYELRANWTPEMVQDMQVQHMDAAVELTRILEEELLKGVEQGRLAQANDRAIVRDVRRMGDQQNPGNVYAPYIAVDQIPEADEEGFLPRPTIMTRYAQRMINPNMYQVVRVANPEFPDGIRFRFTPAMKVEGVEFFEIAKMPLPKGGAKEKLRNEVLEKWARAGMFDNFIVEELPE